MSLTETLQETKENLESLVTYSNEVTGANDTDISSCIASLVSGFGSGGSNSNVLYENETEFTKINDFTSTTQTYAYSFSDIEFRNIVLNSTETLLILYDIKSEGYGMFINCEFINQNYRNGRCQLSNGISFHVMLFEDGTYTCQQWNGVWACISNINNLDIVVLFRCNTSIANINPIKAGTYKLTYKIIKV